MSTNNLLRHWSTSSRPGIYSLAVYRYCCSESIPSNYWNRSSFFKGVVFTLVSQLILLSILPFYSQGISKYGLTLPILNSGIIPKGKYHVNVIEFQGLEHAH